MKSLPSTRKPVHDIGAPPRDGRARAAVDAVLPLVDGGRFAVKRVAGEAMQVEVHAFTDGHDALRVLLQWRAERDTAAHEVEMRPAGNDVWLASFVPPVAGRYFYAASAWVDHFRSWREELKRRVEGADIRLALAVGAGLVEEAAARANGADQKALKQWAAKLRDEASGEADAQAAQAVGLDVDLAELADRHPDRRLEVRSDELPLVADRARARFSTWYEMFPRSASTVAGQHGTFRDVEERLPYVAGMGFDVLYFPPIHPVGRVRRKGRNNALEAQPSDVGSPWAIGSKEGGHKDILPELGTREDFRRLVAKAHEFGLEIALDIAFQCAPDHPYVKQHPQWFRWRPDGSVQYAENPPKKYQDIYPFNFETEDWRALWEELRSVFEHWIGEGVKVFRVDNPHTKAFAFWEWAITEIKREHPEVIFLSEAFTRPKVMHRLAKLGFTQSYTYYTWRNTRRELEDYFTELSQGPGREYFRPNVWPNTPDILNEHLHAAPRWVFMSRLVLAATLCASYGIYGPAYELQESTPRQPGSEEYLDSEKYQLRHWDLQRADSLSGFIGRVNRIRHENVALHSNERLRFFPIDNEQLIAYAKQSEDGSNIILGVVNLDPQFSHSGWLDLDLAWLGLADGKPFQVDDLLTDRSYVWQGARNFIILDPRELPAHVFRVHRGLRDERDSDLFQ